MNLILHNKNILLIALAVGLLLLVPLVAMQFTDQVNWGPFDFILAGGVLFSAGLGCEWIARQGGKRAYRAALGLALLAAVLLVWVDLAVGILGSEDNPANVLYLGVLAVLILGALLARLRPEGMSRALFATALAQVLVTAIAMLLWRPALTSSEGLISVLKAVGVNTLFVVFWLSSAILFQRAR
jgi:hypothetical protein